MYRLIVAALDMDLDVDSSTRNEAWGRPWGLILTDTHAVDVDTLLAKHNLLSRFAERFRGFYDGHEYAIEAEELTPDGSIIVQISICIADLHGIHAV